MRNYEFGMRNEKRLPLTKEEFFRSTFRIFIFTFVP